MKRISHHVKQRREVDIAHLVATATRVLNRYGNDWTAWRDLRAAILRVDPKATVKDPDSWGPEAQGAVDARNGYEVRREELLGRVVSLIDDEDSEVPE